MHIAPRDCLQPLTFLQRPPQPPHPGGFAHACGLRNERSRPLAGLMPQLHHPPNHTTHHTGAWVPLQRLFVPLWAIYGQSWDLSTQNGHLQLPEQVACHPKSVVPILQLDAPGPNGHQQRGRCQRLGNPPPLRIHRAMPAALARSSAIRARPRTTNALRWASRSPCLVDNESTGARHLRQSSEAHSHQTP